MKDNASNSVNTLKKQIKSLQSELFSLRNIIHNLPGDIYWKDAAGAYLGVNASCIDSLNKMGFPYKKNDIIGKTDFELFGEETAKKFKKNDLLVMQGDTEVIDEETAILPSGEKIVQLSAKSPLYDENGKVIGLIGNTRDITYLKKIEANLRYAQERAEAASKIKSEFIANMSHDLRTPLTGVVGMAQDMLMTAQQNHHSLNQSNIIINDSAKKLINEVINTVQQDSQLLINSTDELVQLCNEILDTVILESGKSIEAPEAFNIHDIVNHNIQLLLPAAKHKKLNLTFDIDKKVPPFLIGIRTYLDRSLLNIISNAIKFTKKGFVKVKINIGKNKNNQATYPFKLGDAVNLVITIEDSGIGIPKDKFETIFEHFSRLNASSEGIYKGAGLGLYTVRQYVTFMRGKIDIDSEVGKGSKFTLNLPFTVSNHTDRIKKSLLTSKKQHKMLPLASKSNQHDKNQPPPVLIVEDNALAAMALQNNLKKRYGVESSIARDGAEAIDMVKKHRYALILLDIGLPDMTGIDVAQSIRKLDIAIPTVAITGHANDANKRQEALDAGMQAVLDKPPAEGELEILLQQYVLKEKEATDQISSFFERNKAVIDWQGSLNLYFNDEKLVRDTLNLLANNLNQTKKIIIKSYEKQDIKTLRSELHQLKGGLSYLKLPQLMQAVTAFYAPFESESDAPLKDLKKEYQALIQAIDTYHEVWKKVIALTH